MATYPKPIDTTKLRQILEDHFNEEELRTLCHDLGIDYESLGGRGKAANARELVSHCQTHHCLDELIELALQYRPTIPRHSLLRDTSDDSPFMGLRYFDEARAHLFFGRDGLTAELTARILPPADSPPTNFLAIVGASGSGKSSIARAGLVPAVRRQTDWPIHVITPGSHPLKALAASLTRDSESVTAATTLMDDMAQDPRSLDLYVTRLVEQFDRSPNRVLLVIDQFEELFTLCKDETERRAFVDNLLHVTTADGPTTIVLTLRADFYDPCAPYDHLREALAQHQAYIGPMNTSELRQAIERPATNARLLFEEGLVDLLLRDVGASSAQTPEPGALPLLSHALLETWQRREGDRLTLAGYHAAGGVRGAIAQTAETVYQALLPEQQTIARNIFLRLTELGEGTQDTRRRAELDELVTCSRAEAEVTTVLQWLADKRLVTTSDEGIEVAHEALIREWPTLRVWLDENREGLQVQRRLTEAAQEWAAHDGDKSYLYRGARLETAQEWAEYEKNSLNQLERTFLETSLARQTNELAEAQARVKRETEVARQLRQRTVFLRGALAFASLLAITALLLFKQANKNATAFRIQADIAQSRALTAYAQGLPQNEAMTALLLRINAGRYAGTLQAFTALYQQLPNMAQSTTPLLAHDDLLRKALWNGDESRILTSGEDGTARVWDTQSGDLLLTLSHERTVWDAK